MNSPKAVVSLGFILILSVILTACGGGGSKPTPPAGAPTIQTLLLPQGAVNAPYGPTGNGAVLSATGGTIPYTWSISSGSLPPGLTLNAPSGVISGTPTTTCTAGGSNPCDYPFTVQVTDSKGLSNTMALSIYVEGVVSITTTALPSGSLGVFYSQTLTASGGLAPYTWSISNGSLPTGLQLDPGNGSICKTAGAICGTPTTDGTPTTFTVQVTDSETSPGVPAVGSSNFTITIMSITTASLPPAYVSVPYTASVTVAGGNPNYTWSASNLPPGLALDPSTCVNSKKPTCNITGTPTKGGAYPVTLQVMDGEKSPAKATATLNLTVYNAPPLVVTTTSLPGGIVGIPYSATLAASGGTPPFTWSLTTGSLPTGLSLDAGTGVISGTPTASSTSSFTVQVTDSGSPQQMANSGQLSIIINPPLTNANLNGNYVFTFNGYNSGTLVLMAGSFVADGNGNITSGVLDYNAGAGEQPSNNPTPQMIVPGAGSVYSITPNGLGTMTITTNLNVFKLQIAIRSDGSGTLIQSDPAQPQIYGSGQIRTNTLLGQGQQWPLCGNHVAVGLFGEDSSTPSPARYAGAGVFQFDPVTCVDAENGVMDIDDGGSPSGTTFTGAFNQFNNTTSRGIAGLTFNLKNQFFYAFYLVSSSDQKQHELLLISTNATSEPANLTLWSGLPQPNLPAGWNNSYLATNTAVAELNALDTNLAVDVTAGLFLGQGVSGHTCTSGQNGKPQFDPATFNYDENQGGTSNLKLSSTGTYCIDKTTGRVMLTAFNGGPFAVPPVFYMVKGSQAFVVGTDPAVTSGDLEQQSGSPFTNASIGGSYAGGTIDPITTNVTNAATWLLADGSGNINGTSNTSGTGGPAQQNFTYTYTIDSTGRTIVNQNGKVIGIAYVISPTKFVLLPTTDLNPALSIIGE